MVTIINECGRDEALYGLGLSYGLTSDISIEEFKNNEILYRKVKKVSEKLASKDSGHNKFLESITVWLNIISYRGWWSEFDTYRVGISKQSESTMHTISNRYLSQDDFYKKIPEDTLQHLNGLIDNIREAKKLNKSCIEELEDLKNELPEGFLQRRIVCTNYKVLRNIIQQRKDHRLTEWKNFCKKIIETCVYPEYLNDLLL